MNEIIAAETERMTVDGHQVESPAEIEEEVAAIVQFYKEEEGAEDVNDDFNFVELGGIQFRMAHGHHDDDAMNMAGGKSGKASDDDMWVVKLQHDSILSWCIVN